MNPILFGHDPEKNLIAVHPSGDSKIRLYKKSGKKIISRTEDFYPFFHLSDSGLLENFQKKIWLKQLEGSNYYRYVAAFSGWQDMWDGIRHIIERINRNAPKKIDSYNSINEIFLRPFPVTQYLMQSGKTLFKGIDFNDIHRLQLDIETYSKIHHFSNAGRKEDRIILIALSDNRGWEAVLGAKNLSESELLSQCISVINERDPDVVEGHNICNFDIPYILKRCELHGIDFLIGRDGSAPHGTSSRTAFAEHEIEYTSYEVNGRHIIDTWLLVQAYDVSKRNMDNYSLKYAAKHLGVDEPNRTHIPPDKISWFWEHNSEALKSYALADARETRAISERLSASSFYLTQMLPYNYGTVARLGSAAKIESLLLREYLRQRISIPRPESGSQTSGGYTDIFYTGVLGPVVHADVESLYPSIMLSHNIHPASDSLKIFSHALEHLTKLRLAKKKAYTLTTDSAAKAKLDAMQASFKILINSFYGYLGYSRALFNDYLKADAVTSTGQELLKQLIREIELHNGTIIEVDTDGIYFIPPDNIAGEKNERFFVERLNRSLPRGIVLAYGGRYKKILSYKKKNYALLGYDEKILVRGSSLISRNMEHFGRMYVHQCIEAVLGERYQDLHDLYLGVERSLRDHSLEARDFARTELLKESIQRYQQDVDAGKRNRTASYETAVRSSREYRQGDKISFYLTGRDANIKGFEHAKETLEYDPNFPDENTAFYLKRLEEFSKKFESFFSEADFRAIFSTEDMFGFDPSSIRLVRKKIQEEEKLDTEWTDPSTAIALDL